MPLGVRVDDTVDVDHYTKNIITPLQRDAPTNQLDALNHWDRRFQRIHLACRRVACTSRYGKITVW
jgi:hypothetical protein